MIGKLSGIIDSFGENYLILDVQGVGYFVQASRRTLASIGQKGDPASLLIDTHVREDAITLFGFAESAEQEWFRLLTSVQGVGAKAGLAILTVCPSDRLALAIASGDKAAVQQADGVGPKLATRIVTELKDKAAKIDLGQPSGSVSYEDIASDAPASNDQQGVDQDAVSALVNLGYARSDAYQAVMKAKGQSDSGANDNLEALIREALKELSA